jgi:hypothetical protein
MRVMSLATRLLKLERTAALTLSCSPLEQFQRAFWEAAVRLTGKRADLISDDDPALDQVIKDVQDSFVRKLNAASTESLINELERIAFGGDVEAREAAKRAALGIREAA